MPEMRERRNMEKRKYRRKTAISMQKSQDVDSVEKNIAVETKQAEVIEMDELFDYINEKKQSLRNNVGIVKQLEKTYIEYFQNACNFHMFIFSAGGPAGQFAVRGRTGQVALRLEAKIYS